MPTRDTTVAPPLRPPVDLNACSEEDLFKMQRDLQAQLALQEASRKRKASAIDEIIRLRRTLNTG